MRELGRIVREVCELGTDAVVWRQHLLERMEPIIGASVGGAYVGSLKFDPTQAPAEAFIDYNMPRLWLEYLGKRDLTSDPTNTPIMARLNDGVTALNTDLCGLAVYRKSEHYDTLMRKIQMDSYIVSLEPIHEHNLFSGLHFMHQSADRPFRPQDILAVQILHRELVYLWKTPSLAPQPQWKSALPKRLVEVLNCLTSGLSEKEIARRLSIRPATVHNHVTRLYKAADVSSRGELLAAAIPSSTFRPRLLV